MTDGRRRLARLLVAVAMAMFALTLSSGAAHATPAAAATCGSGYTLINQHNVPEAAVREYYSPAVNRLCALVVLRTPGTPTRICLGYDNDIDCGIYREYAGPVYADASRCRTLTVIIGDRQYVFPPLCP